MVKNFSLPGGVYSNQLAILALSDLWYNKRGLFKNDVNIDAIYDSFSGRWNGGRVVVQKAEKASFIEDRIGYFNNRGISFRQIFTNYFIKDYLDDKQCNHLMEILSKNKINQVVLSSDFALYTLKQRYPDIFYISSCTKYIQDIPSLVEEHKKDWNEVCLWVSMNNINVYKSIPEALRYKTEILICQNCRSDCPYCYKHALNTSIAVLHSFGENIKIPCSSFTCPMDGKTDVETVLNRYNTLSNEDIDNLTKLGINHFKITGRFEYNISSFIKLLAYYLVDSIKYQDFLDSMQQKIGELQDSGILKVQTTPYYYYATGELLPSFEFTDSIEPTAVLNNTFLSVVGDKKTVDEELSGNWLKKSMVNDALYLENSAVGVLVTTSTSPTFEAKVKRIDCIRTDNFNTTYELASQSRSGVPYGSKNIETNYGQLIYLAIEPRTKYKNTLLPKVCAYNDVLLFEIISLKQKQNADLIRVAHCIDIINNLSTMLKSSTAKEQFEEVIVNG